MKFPNLIDLDQKHQNVWFMSDLHYGHENVLKFGLGRPFGDLAEMNSYLAETVRNTLNKKDILFDLGDLFWKTEETEMKSLCKCFPEKKIKFIGNHDKENLYCPGGVLRHYFWLVADLIDLKIRYHGENIRMTLSHYPILEWNHRHYGSIHIHGHCHGNIDRTWNSIPQELRIDVGFDGVLAREKGTFILSLDDVLEALRKKTGGLPFEIWAKQNLEQQPPPPGETDAADESK